MTREKLNRLRILRAEIENSIRELRKLEKKEQSATQYGQSLLRSLKHQNAVDLAQKEELVRTITEKQKKYMALRANVEAEIQKEPNHYVRVVLSLVYVDGLTYDEAAAAIQGCCTGGGIIQLLVRYFGGSESQ